MNNTQPLLVSSRSHRLTKLNSNLIIAKQSSLNNCDTFDSNINGNLNIQYDSSEYGLANPATFKFYPREYGILSNYSKVKDIYSVILSPTLISLETNKITNKNVVKKTILKEKLVSDLQKDFAYQECIIHSKMRHQNVVELYDYTENEKEIVMLMEYCNQPTYFEDKIEERLTPIKNERKLQSFVGDVLEGMDYVHSNGFVHCDIKLQNILINDDENNYDLEFPQVKICDFGLAHIKDPSTGEALMKLKCGTHSYVAPETGDNAVVTDKLDMWSFGVMLYQMCVAYKPTQMQNYQYGSGPIPFRKFDWRKRSPLLQDLVSKCLTVNPKDRISSKEAMEHPWLFEEI